MQKGRSRPVRHAPIAVGRARRNALEEPEHAPHIPDLVERRDEVHLRCARVSEADLHPRSGQGLDQAFCSVHLFVPPLCSLRFGATRIRGIRKLRHVAQRSQPTRSREAAYPLYCVFLVLLGRCLQITNFVELRECEVRRKPISRSSHSGDSPKFAKMAFSEVRRFFDALMCFVSWRTYIPSTQEYAAFVTWPT